MEFVVSTDLEKSLPAAIEWNHEEIKRELAEKLKAYSGLVVTEDTVPAAKKDRAALNALKNAMETRRKEIKAQYMAPYDAFERSVKEIVSMIDKPIRAIDRQVKGFEETRKAEKRAAIEARYRESAGELAGVLPLERVYNPKWENATVPLMQALKELDSAIWKAENNLGIIKAFGGEYQAQMLDLYLRTLDMSAVLAEKNRLEAQAEALKKLETGKAPAETKQPPAPPPAETGELKTIRVEFRDTTAAFRREMRELTRKHNISYGGIT